MEKKEQWISKVTEKIRNSPVAANFCFGVILFSFEKIVQIEFACPCNSKWNLWIASVFFIVPALIVFMLMCVIRRCKCKMSFCEDFWYSSFPAITWMAIVFLDGRYYTCAKTPWSGKYEIIDGSAPHRWCKPSANSSEEFLSQTQGWYSQSQLIGFMVALMLTVFYSAYWCCCNKSPTNEAEVKGAFEMEIVKRQPELEPLNGP